MHFIMTGRFISLGIILNPRVHHCEKSFVKLCEKLCRRNISSKEMAQQGDGYLEQAPGFATRAIHVGQSPDQWSSFAIVPPITLASTFKQDGSEPKYDYGRSGNPSRSVLEQCLASLDGAKHALAFSSGLGATTALTQLLRAGDHIVSSDDIYGGTNRLFSKIIARMNVETTFVDATDTEKVRLAIRPNTKMVWMESPTNPLLKVVDIRAVAEITSSRKDILLVVDNTFLTPYFQRPLELGADVVVYSITKYLNGHSDVIMGSIATSNDEVFEELKFIQKASGIVPSPFDCYLVNRSLKTLAVRMREHMKNAFEVARFLEKHPFVEKVLHPGLPSHPQHQVAKRQSYGHSGMLSFYLKGDLKESKAFLKALKLFTYAESLGGFESLAEVPSVMTHASVPLEQRTKLGISDSLIRLSVGLECSEDLIADLNQALLVAAKEKMQSSLLENGNSLPVEHNGILIEQNASA
ncbi:putative cystathionine gamma-lyase 2 [Bacillus rossius redtenbacheri]|uniref:putative cystathionine gamma-lyase 2 n=1 Tax=Bacillus rossius redtenbacheri TaxID=93214 RepID=UPI002FDCDAD3